MDKTKTEAEEQGQITKFCSCKNSCQRKTGPKRAGCPCKDAGLYCSEQCKCGTNRIVYKNIEPKGSTEAELLSDFSNLVIDESDGSISDNTPDTPNSSPGNLFADCSVKQDTPNFRRRHGIFDNVKPKTSNIDNVKPDTPNTRSAKAEDSTQTILPESFLKPVHKINNGYALVIHNRYFHRLQPRKGSEKDLDAIKSFCQEADLKIDVQENLKVNGIRAHCRKLTDDEKRFQNYDGFVCFILSHGNSSGICGVYDDTISVQEIVSYFKENNDLLGKPKLFFIQACRTEGLVEDDGIEIDHKKRLCPPDSSDILIAHSTLDGELSFRDIRTGSWFIQTLMKKLKVHAESSHLMDIMTTVNDEIAGSEFEGNRQMPIQVSTLTKFVYFKMATFAKL